ncbi:MAG: PQQ-binding-like beta-propeller repeat protein [Acidobacteriota bacterium]
MKRLVAVALVGLVAAACGPKPMFRLSSEDNDRSALVAALAHRELPAQRVPVNAAGKPRVFVVAGAAQKQIVAYDLVAGAALWTQPANVTSRVQVGGDFIVELEGKQLVARDQQHGNVRWKLDVPGAFVGSAADRERAYVVWREGTDQKPHFHLAGYDGASGGRLWKADAEGQLGAPVAQGGVVYAPYFDQWLSIIDGKTGKQLARIRNEDDQISMVRATSQTVYYGSKQGVYRLDARSANGTRKASTYGQVKIPPQLDRASYGRDVYDPVQNAYTAADRARVLFASEQGDEGPLKFQGDAYAIHYFRYVLGFSTSGELVWAYSHPRVELVASTHTGAAIVAIAQNGELVALDPKTGALRLEQKLQVSGPVMGATFDADGWAPPPGTGEPVATVAALAAIAKDRDARFDKVKELAVTALAKLPGPEVTKQLLALLSDQRAPQKLKDQVADQLVERKDPASLPVLVAQLQTRTDFLAKTEPESLGPVAKAIAGLGGSKLDPKDVASALAALRVHLEAPTTQTPDLVQVIAAMAAIGGGSERPALASHLLLYHADDDLGGDLAWVQAIVHALQTHGGPGERELLRQVAEDPRTKPPLAAAIQSVLVDN